MSASRLLFLIGSSVIRKCNNLTNISYPFTQIRFTKPLLSPVVRYRSYNCTSATLETNTVEPLVSPKNHPWPEWVAFVDRLKSKGYFPESTKDGDESIYTDMTLLKDACLNFSRDRSNIFKKLSTQDMQRVVEKGCPNLFRKVVNSGKRLRMHLNLEEAEVCGVCNLRGSCDRAYVILKDSEGAARTVDIMRVLLHYAFDPSVISSGAMSPGSELIEVSARHLLSELVELSEIPVDPELPKTAPKASPRKKQSVSSGKDGSEHVGMKRRDSSGLEGEMPTKGFEMKPGDWACSQCNFMNFSRNAQCLRCKAEGPSQDARVPVQEMKKGDWNCPQCNFMNFAGNTKCKRCQELRPKRQLNPGEWECLSCDFLNFRNNMVCKKCNCERPKDAKTQSKYEQQLWTKPY
ncbi:zinc finger protein VAR3, chloroplastic [Lycium barbarum]|uniref:zinc finger protein VAR3, chloroplastic n=1 Tax=Lycium barbarum TaxID=112863 RepID=UPI00293E1C7E|nr:zinc finger protein VAR3, chloroplastic [Lycium barbarum]